MIPIETICSHRYRAAHKSGSRTPSVIKWIVLHSTEGGTAAGAAQWFANNASKGSAHLVVDDDACYETLYETDVPWAAPGANTNGYHIEQAGYASWTRTAWKSKDMTLRRAAYKAALRAKKYGIPLRWVGPIGLRWGRKGFTTHRDVTYAWPAKGRAAGWHTDPGDAYPKDIFMEYVKTYSAKL